MTQSPPPPAEGTAADSRQAAHRVEFLYIEDCPSHERALELLKEALREQPIPMEFTLYRIETDEEAQAARFPGSPTIRIDGADIDENPDLPIGLSCRGYRHDNGRISPLPPRDKIVEALRRAANRSLACSAR